MKLNLSRFLVVVSGAAPLSLALISCNHTSGPSLSSANALAQAKAAGFATSIAEIQPTFTDPATVKASADLPAAVSAFKAQVPSDLRMGKGSILASLPALSPKALATVNPLLQPTAESMAAIDKLVASGKLNPPPDWLKAESSDDVSFSTNLQYLIRYDQMRTWADLANNNTSLAIEDFKKEVNLAIALLNAHTIACQIPGLNLAEQSEVVPMLYIRNSLDRKTGHAFFDILKPLHMEIGIAKTIQNQGGIEFSRIAGTPENGAGSKADNDPRAGGIFTVLDAGLKAVTSSKSEGEQANALFKVMANYDHSLDPGEIYAIKRPMDIRNYGRACRQFLSARNMADAYLIGMEDYEKTGKLSPQMPDAMKQYLDYFSMKPFVYHCDGNQFFLLSTGVYSTGEILTGTFWIKIPQLDKSARKPGGGNDIGL